jgi:hypothetical protein
MPELITIAGASCFSPGQKLTTVTFSDQITEVGNDAFNYCPSSLTELHLVGQPDVGGNAVNGIVSSCGHLDAAQSKMQVATFTFSIGERILAQLSAPELLNYINAALSIPLASVPFVANIAADKRVFDLGSAVSTPAGLAHVDNGLFSVIKVHNVSYTWNGSSWG